MWRVYFFVIQVGSRRGTRERKEIRVLTYISPWPRASPKGFVYIILFGGKERKLTSIESVNKHDTAMDRGLYPSTFFLQYFLDHSFLS